MCTDVKKKNPHQQVIYTAEQETSENLLISVIYRKATTVLETEQNTIRSSGILCVWLSAETIKNCMNRGK